MLIPGVKINHNPHVGPERGSGNIVPGKSRLSKISSPHRVAITDVVGYLRLQKSMRFLCFLLTNT